MEFFNKFLDLLLDRAEANSEPAFAQCTQLNTSESTTK
jgi:hypothetical protein